MENFDSQELNKFKLRNGGRPKWLLTDDDFDKGASHDLFDIFVDNGIISEDAAAMQFIFASTENDIPDCPFCLIGSNSNYVIGTYLWKCKSCYNKYSITSKRYLDNTKLSLPYWWRMCYIVTDRKKFNSNELSRDLGVTQKTAWNMLSTLKKALNDYDINLKSIYSAMEALMKIEKQPTTKNK